MSGFAGECDRDCELGRPHDLECRNYIETELPCPVCNSTYGRHLETCVLRHIPAPQSTN